MRNQAACLRAGNYGDRMSAAVGVELSAIVAALDALYELDSTGPDVAMSRHVPRVYDGIGLDWRRWTAPSFSDRFNGLMVRGHDRVQHIYAACFPSQEVLAQWLAVAVTGDLLITHHPIDVRNGSPPDTWAEGFVPIAGPTLELITRRGLNMYSCHAPMDTSQTVGTSAAIIEALDGTIESSFWPYGSGFAGHVCSVEPVTGEAIVAWAKRTFEVDVVEVAGPVRARIDRIAVVAGIGDRVGEMVEAERLGAQAYLTGEIHVRIEGEYGRAKYADVERYATTTAMMLLGVSHAASEDLVLRTQLSRWFQRFPVPYIALREPRWWR
jgi:putative NIF3 family GTP cyclohydrolase 1 type 2